ncbi:DNA-processing protein DprA [Sporosarcina ureilytica]|uniref:DNA protecting protein DprA n=1 Tax=Sporosarcina ureilytica TaxID=298596 RepID=A0A1D8JHT8_9BACL|nr:DNA-processing protein DprA [Sporosarcina ureilytica]AOV08279.1 DNA protecting protein DprA [Sporosarcina ureilytica]
MNLTEVEKRLLVLHYVFPVPANRFTKLYEVDPELIQFSTFPTEKLAFILNITPKKASKIKGSVAVNSTLPFEELYDSYGIIPIPFTNPLFPKSLLTMIDPPAVLYVQGNTQLLAEKMKVSIIGSRKATFYSEKSLTFIVPPLVKNNVIIVSGLASGADTFAHQSAIKYGGKTIAVLGHGLFHIYPRENSTLKDEIGKNHLLVTEYPPYVRPERWTFPMRNRIISGLSNAIIVTEAAKKSGTMSTVEHALEHGKDVFAVPGPITSRLSEGPNNLISEGAEPLSNGYQVIETLR